MTNPNNIVRVRARNGGRASVLEANAWAQIFKVGLLKGNGVIQNTSADMNVLVGGSSSNPDVLIAETPSGYKVALDLVGQQAVAITAPASNSRISSIVAYTDDLSLSSSDATVTGSPSSCGLIVVNGTSASSPSAPDDATIRSAITADGATGSQAAYVVIANVTVASSTTAITNSLIDVFSSTDGLIQARNIDFDEATPLVFEPVVDGIRGSIIIGKFMLAFRRIDFTGKSVSTEWGNIYRSAINAQNINIAPSAGPDFSSKPYVTVSLDIASGTCWLGMYGNGGVHKVGSNLRWGFSNNELQLLRATSGNVSGSVIILALGEIA